MKYRVVGMYLVGEDYINVELEPLDKIDDGVGLADSTAPGAYNILMTMSNMLKSSRTYEILFTVAEIKENGIEVGSVVELDINLLER